MELHYYCAGNLLTRQEWLMPAYYIYIYILKNSYIHIYAGGATWAHASTMRILVSAATAAAPKVLVYQFHFFSFLFLRLKLYLQLVYEASYYLLMYEA